MMRDKRVQADLATCRRLLTNKKIGDRKLSSVIKLLEEKLIPGRRGRKGVSDAQLLDLYGAVKAIQATGCSVSEARRRYARHVGRKSARHFERLHIWLMHMAEFGYWPEKDLARAVTDMQSRLQAEGLLPPTPKSPEV